jgi:hypothetical protein
MSIRAVPLIALVVIMYLIVVFASGLLGIEASAGSAEGILKKQIFPITMMNGNVWSVSWGDIIILVLLATLFIEILKATYTSTTAMVDHGLSMAVFVACLVMFLMVPEAQTSVFFFITVATLIDVIAGYTIGIRVARRDIGFGGMGD